MKTLIVLRHAKSSWDHPDLSDFDRPLNKRGERAAPFMGELIASEGTVPEKVVSSPARRARMTAEAFCAAAGLSAGIDFDERIYGAGANTLTYVLSEIDDSVESAMIVGHNPGFEMLVHALTGEARRMPTAAVAVIDLDIGRWSEIGGGVGRLRRHYIPREEMGE